MVAPSWAADWVALELGLLPVAAAATPATATPIRAPII